MNNETLKKIEKEVIKNAKKGTKDMFIEADEFSIDDHGCRFTVVQKGHPIIAAAVGFNRFKEVTSTKLSVDDKQIDNADNDTVVEIWKALEAIYDKQEDTIYETEKKKEEKEKKKKVAKTQQNAATIFNMLGEQIFCKRK